MAKANRKTFRLRLEEAMWVGKSKPVIRNIFSDENGKKYTIFSSKNAVQDIRLNTICDVEADIDCIKVHDGVEYQILKRPYVKDYELQF